MDNILDAAKRIDNLIDSNLDDEIFLDQLEFCCLDEKIEESDEEIDFRTNKSLLPNIFKYKILFQEKSIMCRVKCIRVKCVEVDISITLI